MWQVDGAGVPPPIVESGEAGESGPRTHVAVIGAGAAGLAAAWTLAGDPAIRVTLYEAAARAGGHAETVTIDTSAGPLGVDTGFMVFNERNYPQFTALLRTLGVESQTSDMSFAVSLDDGRLEYAGSRRLATMLAQPANLLRPRFLRMVADIVRFNREAGALDSDLTLGEALARARYSAGFIDDHLLPMVACIWSVPPEEAMAFPFKSVRAFFTNHGLLSLKDRPAWRVVTGGSARYVERLLASRPITTRLATPIRGIERREDRVIVHALTGEAVPHDAAVMATPADVSLRLLERPSAAERAFLGPIRYARNVAYLHSDVRLMPLRPAAWASWNYLGRRGEKAKAVAVSYWLNRLQGLTCREPVLVTLNPERPPFEPMVWREFSYNHPILDYDPATNRAALEALQGNGRTWYCGSYVGYGFHEDAIASGIAAAEALRARVLTRGAHGPRVADA